MTAEAYTTAAHNLCHCAPFFSTGKRVPCWQALGYQIQLIVENAYHNSSIILYKPPLLSQPDWCFLLLAVLVQAKTDYRNDGMLYIECQKSFHENSPKLNYWGPFWKLRQASLIFLKLVCMTLILSDLRKENHGN